MGLRDLWIGIQEALGAREPYHPPCPACGEPLRAGHTCEATEEARRSLAAWKEREPAYEAMLEEEGWTEYPADQQEGGMQRDL